MVTGFSTMRLCLDHEAKSIWARLSVKRRQRILAIRWHWKRRDIPITASMLEKAIYRTDREEWQMRREGRATAQWKRRAKANPSLFCEQCEILTPRLSMNDPRYREFVDYEVIPRKCQHCGSEFTPQRRSAKFCSAKCRVYANRKQKRE
jgi:hypothetical protein